MCYKTLRKISAKSTNQTRSLPSACKEGSSSRRVIACALMGGGRSQLCSVLVRSSPPAFCACDLHVSFRNRTGALWWGSESTCPFNSIRARADAAFASSSGRRAGPPASGWRSHPMTMIAPTSLPPARRSRSRIHRLTSPDECPTTPSPGRGPPACVGRNRIRSLAEGTHGRRLIHHSLPASQVPH